MTTPTASSGKDDKKEFEQELNDRYQQWRRYRKFNRNFDAGFTITTIILTLTITVIGTEGIQIDENVRKTGNRN